MEETDEPVEPQPLWEYPGTLASTPATLLSFPLQEIGPVDVTGSLRLATPGFRELSESSLATWTQCRGNGVAFWLEWDLGAGGWMSCGLLGKPKVGEVPNSFSQTFG